MQNKDAILKELDPVTRSSWIKFFLTLSLIFIPLAPTIAILYVVIRDFVVGIASLRWDKTEGSVIVSTIKSNGDGGGNHLVYYRYMVENQQYIRARKTIGGADDSSKLWDEMNKYKTDDIVSVYYNPKNPGKSTLITGVQWSNLLWIILIPLIEFFQLLLFLFIHFTIWDLSWLLRIFGLQ